MSIGFLTTLRTAIALAVIAVSITACSVNCARWDSHQPWDRTLEVPSTEVGVKPNVWTRRAPLEAFLLGVIQKDGIASLTTDHGMQCSPRDATPGCSDCYVCRKTVLLKALTVRDIRLTCIDDGEIFVDADIGPGSKVIAMTYLRPRIYEKKP